MLQIVVGDLDYIFVWLKPIINDLYLLHFKLFFLHNKNSITFFFRSVFCNKPCDVLLVLMVALMVL